MARAMSILPGSCTGCGACWAECPQGAVLREEVAGRDRYRVDPLRCTLCREHPLGPRCRAVCPVLGCLVELELT